MKVMLTAVAALFGCMLSPDVPVSEPATSQPVASSEMLTPDVLADRVFAAYAEAPGLSFVVRVTEGGRTAEVRCDMAPNRLCSQLYVEGKLETVVLVGPADDNPQQLLVEEHRLKETDIRSVSGAPDMARSLWVTTTLVYEATRPTGTGDIWLVDGIEDYGCLVGSYFQSWLGRHSHKADFFKRRITDGTLMPPVSLNERPCHVVNWWSNVEGSLRLDTFYIDANDYMVRRWDSVVSYPQVAPIVRSRVISDLRLGPIADTAWTFQYPAPVAMSEIDASTTSR
jgi:hypothetical protein